MELKIGLICEINEEVTLNNTASALGSGGIDVYATPAMIALMEKSAMNAVQSALAEGLSTVGTMVNIKHMAATPVGMTVTAKAELTEIADKRLLFKVEAFDGKDKIGEGTHERFIINVEKFISRVNAKKV